MLTPGSPLTFLATFHIVKENFGGRGTHRVIVRFVAHHDDLVFEFEPGYFLNVKGFDDMLFFLWGTDLLQELFDSAQFVEGHIILHCDGEVLRIFGKFKSVQVLVRVRFISLDLDFLVYGPQN